MKDYACIHSFRHAFLWLLPMGDRGSRLVVYFYFRPTKIPQLEIYENIDSLSLKAVLCCLWTNLFHAK